MDIKKSKFSALLLKPLWLLNRGPLLVFDQTLRPQLRTSSAAMTLLPDWRSRTVGLHRVVAAEKPAVDQGLIAFKILTI